MSLSTVEFRDDEGGLPLKGLSVNFRTDGGSISENWLSSSSRLQYYRILIVVMIDVTLDWSFPLLEESKAKMLKSFLFFPLKSWVEIVQNYLTCFEFFNLGDDGLASTIQMSA